MKRLSESNAAARAFSCPPVPSDHHENPTRSQNEPRTGVDAVFCRTRAAKDDDRLRSREAPAIGGFTSCRARQSLRSAAIASRGKRLPNRCGMPYRFMEVSLG
jgi:hypothetical protein